MAHPTTYDPVLDRRFLSHGPAHAPANPEHLLRSPAPGRALVLVPEEGPPLTVRPGEQVPGARYGSRQEVFTVDTTEHRLQLALLLAGRDTPSAFRCEIGVTCRIVNPAAVVAHGVRDMSEAWAGPVREHLERVSRTYTGSQPREAEQALNAALRDFAGDSAVRLHGARIELLTVATPFTGAANPGASGPGASGSGASGPGASGPGAADRGTTSGAASGGPRRSRVRGARPGGGRPEGTAPASAPSPVPPPDDASHVVPGEVVGRGEATPPPPRFAPPPPPSTPPPPPEPPPHKPSAAGPPHGAPVPPRPAHPPYAPPTGEPPAPPTPPPAATPPSPKPRTSRVRGTKPAGRGNPESDGGRVSGS
ncbi:hypothetical protein DSC45_19015 [Streptomyces sp. YIM 130001]|uniref:hypothetical protein n=1 Tax=Streptomyces sp. YIM 130001 TaxID=2259644 RepID=UPI000E65C0B5|nr:hypothetical protein [Streptomyces sp. YIM 130001]RII14988.1 hypothetical protein DSC45_19015 [Streptomyces sp. YIM 130001]